MTLGDTHAGYDENIAVLVEAAVQLLQLVMSFQF